MYELTLDVTQDHVNNGHAGSPQKCPVALAIIDYCKQHNLYLKWLSVSLDQTVVDFRFGSYVARRRRFHFEPSKAMTTFIEDVDRTQEQPEDPEDDPNVMPGPSSFTMTLL